MTVCPDVMVQDGRVPAPGAQQVAVVPGQGGYSSTVSFQSTGFLERFAIPDLVKHRLREPLGVYALG